MKRAVFCNRWLPYLLVLPQMVVVVVFFFWPAFDSLRLALFKASPFGDRLKFVRLQNFTRLLTSPAYHESALNSLVFAYSVTFRGLAMALGLAVLANQKTRGLVFYRTALLWPYGIAPAVAGIIWLFIFHPTYGIVPYLLSFITAYTFNWLLQGWIALLLIMLTSIWTQLGYNVAFFLAGLQSIPASILEAASVDGAGPLRFLWSILLPLSWTPLAALAIVLFISTWNQYLWPLIVTTSADMQVVVIGIAHLVPSSGTQLPEWNIIMAAAILALLPPVLVILVLQRWFVQGLVEGEK